MTSFESRKHRTGSNGNWKWKRKYIVWKERSFYETAAPTAASPRAKERRRIVKKQGVSRDESRGPFRASIVIIKETSRHVTEAPCPCFGIRGRKGTPRLAPVGRGLARGDGGTERMASV